MKTLNYMVAIAAASTILMTSCRNKAKTDNGIDDIDNLIEENSVTVKHNSLTDTILNIDGNEIGFAEVDRIFNADDNDQFYLSVRAIIPQGASGITDSLYRTMAFYYQLIAMDSVSVPASASTPAAFAGAVDQIGGDFLRMVKPMVNDTIVNGYLMNVDMRPVYGTDKFLTYAIYADSYTGGAHGNVDTYFETYNTANDVPYTFETMFTAQGQEKVRERLVNIIAKDKEQSVDDYLLSLNAFVGSDKPITVKDFPVYHVGITSLGFVFTYPKYSIAAGFEGCPAYVIPYDEIAEYMNK